MHAYCQKMWCPNGILLYPKCGTSEYIIDHHIEDAATVSIRAIDLNRDLRSRTSSSGAKFAVFLKNRFGRG
jgi:hypothetical protein